MAFDSLPGGCSPDDCEPDYYEEPDDPDRYYEAKLEREYDQERDEL